jgi:hypothetical protein
MVDFVADHRPHARRPSSTVVARLARLAPPEFGAKHTELVTSSVRTVALGVTPFHARHQPQ